MNEFIIYQSNHVTLERDYCRGGKRKWMSFGIHFDWQKPHIIFYFGNLILTLGITYWGNTKGVESS